MHPIGTRWLIEHFKPPSVVTSHLSSLAGKRSSIVHADGRVEETFPRSYWPGDTPLDHVTFALKYEPIGLDLLHQVFMALSVKEVDRHIRAQPSSKHARRIGFLFEQLTARNLRTSVSGNFIPILDTRRYFVGPERLDARWRVRDNLLGSAGFCPIVRRTPSILRKLRSDFSAEMRRLSNAVPPELLSRAIDYLYRKETKASFEIEHESIGGLKEQRFLQVLSQVGTTPADHLLDEARLSALQRLIVDRRYANSSFRKNQNYIGQTLPNYQERIHYVCPPPLLVRTLMAGLRTFLLRSEGLPAPVRAAVVSFGFVYIHPFEDGNGRIHRLLLHETLAKYGYTDPGVVLPLSAGILRDPHAYANVLESFSRTVLGRVSYDLDKRGRMTVKNPDKVDGVWRYPDLTLHTEYVLDLIENAVTKELPAELDVLQRFDSAGAAIAEVVDLPNRKLQLMLKLLHQNHGRLSKIKHEGEFPELSQAEVRKIEEAFAMAFDVRSADERPSTA